MYLSACDVLEVLACRFSLKLVSLLCSLLPIPFPVLVQTKYWFTFLEDRVLYSNVRLKTEGP